MFQVHETNPGLPQSPLSADGTNAGGYLIQMHPCVSDSLREAYLVENFERGCEL